MFSDFPVPGLLPTCASHARCVCSVFKWGVSGSGNVSVSAHRRPPWRQAKVCLLPKLIKHAISCVLSLCPRDTPGTLRRKRLFAIPEQFLSSTSLSTTYFPHLWENCMGTSSWWARQPPLKPAAWFPRHLNRCRCSTQYRSKPAFLKHKMNCLFIEFHAVVEEPSEFSVFTVICNHSKSDI